MKLTEQDIDLIDAYLAGELSGEDLLAFELRMAGDAEFAEEVGMMEALSVGLKRSVLEDKMRMLKQVDSRQSIVDGGIDVEKASMDNGLSTMDLKLDDSGAVLEKRESIDHGPSTMDSKGKVRGLWKVLAVAASLGVIGFVGSWWVGEMAVRERYANHFDPKLSDYERRRSNGFSELNFELSKAYGLYDLGYYSESAALFEKEFIQNNDSIAIVYSAWSYLGALDKINLNRIINKIELIDTIEFTKINEQKLKIFE